MYYSDGGKYDGDWKNDKMNGKGVYYNSNGDKIEGMWNDGNLIQNGV